MTTDWTAILAANGIPEPPGREEAIRRTAERLAARKAAEEAVLQSKRNTRNKGK